MSKKKKIILITDILSGQQWAYTSIIAALEHQANPIDVGQRRWSQLVQENGYPFLHSGCRVDYMQQDASYILVDGKPVRVLTGAEARAENEQIFSSQK